MFLIDCTIIIFITLILFTIKFVLFIPIHHFLTLYHIITILLSLMISFFKYRSLKNERGREYFLIIYVLGSLRYYIMFLIIFFYYFSSRCIQDTGLIIFMLKELIPYVVIGFTLWIDDIIYSEKYSLSINILLTFILIILFILFILL